MALPLRILGLENPLTNNGQRISYLNTESVQVLRAGYLYVFTETAVSAGDPVYYRHTASGANTELGRFRNNADTATAALIENAAFEFSAAANSVVVIRLPSIAQ
jgi:hypothetical protein